LILIMCERRWPVDRDRRLFRRRWFDDLVLYTLAQSYVAGLAIGALIAWLDGLTGWSSRGPLRRLSTTETVCLFVVAHDLVAYWVHRAQHRFEVLWRLHEAHHSSTEVDWLAGSRSHILEILVNQTLEFAPMVLLGASADALMAKATVDAVWGMFIHANVRIDLGPLGWLVNGPRLHRAHHARVFEGYGANFGTKLACWDRLFDTYRPPNDEPPGYGLVEAYPEGYLAQTLHAFRSTKR
jgi:sterol desaturase/sphingolipid hydroxylase (fatty acid hydroxylase superfamily)